MSAKALWYNNFVLFNNLTEHAEKKDGETHD